MNARLCCKSPGALLSESPESKWSPDPSLARVGVHLASKSCDHKSFVFIDDYL